MAGYFYLLFSFKDKKTYSGSTDDLTRRFDQHKKGKVDSTKNRLPVKIIYFEEYKTLEEARYIEKYYKSCAGRKKLKEKLKNKI
ncbi:MAG: excinuclease ABC subunit C [Candidatus Moranbacteria bacterium CG23_combo_of_CG06-09_8_20_14_all_35_22]|nr:MAG: excinuclease ABC subunit C [Candidatus Moranbacteria bacterium CG23_combo_of_CG06-09_8_20_14_all_35_22]